MKRIILNAAFIVMIALGLTGCYRDVLLPDTVVDPDGPPQQVSYKEELSPMLNTKCATEGCHVSGAHKPYLTPDISYTQIVSGGYVNTAIPKESILYKAIYGEMAEYIPSAEDKQKVYDWIRNGAPNN